MVEMVEILLVEMFRMLTKKGTNVKNIEIAEAGKAGPTIYRSVSAHGLDGLVHSHRKKHVWVSIVSVLWPSLPPLPPPLRPLIFIRNGGKGR